MQLGNQVQGPGATSHQTFQTEVAKRAIDLETTEGQSKESNLVKVVMLMAGLLILLICLLIYVATEDDTSEPASPAAPAAVSSAGDDSVIAAVVLPCDVEGVSCGTNAMCSNSESGYICECVAGFSGGATLNQPAICGKPSQFLLPARG